jgi:signal transduction histidine kinase
MRRLFASVAWRSAAIVAALQIAATAVFVWWDHRSDDERQRDEQVALVSAVLAVTTDQDALRTTVTRSSPTGQLAVHLANGRRIGPSRANAKDVTEVIQLGEPAVVDIDDGRVHLRPVTAAHGEPAVIELYQPDGGVNLGFIGVLVLVGLIGTGLAVFASDRQTTPVVRQLRELSTVATSQDVSGLSWQPSGPAGPELAALAAMINRVDALARQLVEREHKMIADVSHRLRTPLTALRLDVDKIGPGPVADRIRSAVVALEHDVGDIIRAAGQPPEPIEPAIACDLAEVVRRRMQFWQVLADNQGRRCEVHCPDGPAPVPLAEDDVADIVNNLVSNVFRHTVPGTALAVSVGRHAGWISLVVDDGGPGIVDPEAALQRGVSGGDSTGLGLDIVRTKVEGTGGAIYIERGKLGGARVRLRFAEAGLPPKDKVTRAWRLRHSVTDHDRANG